MMLKLLRLSPLLAIFTTLACGDDSGNSTPAAPFESQESDEQIASGLTPAEQTAFCDELLVYFKSEISDAQLVKVGCYFLAIAFTGDDPSMCSQTAQACIADPESLSSDSSVDCDNSKLADCSATVAELEACYTDTVTKMKSIVASVSCSMSPAQMSTFDDKPASCAPVEAKCPKLFEDDAPSEP